MRVFTSIDIMSGRVVRLEQGKPELAKVYSEDPKYVMRCLYSSGFKNFHIVDLDAALGYGDNSGLISELLKEKGYKHVAGGIRSVESLIGYIKRGADRVVVSTLAFTSPWALVPYKDKVVISLDVKGENIAYEGWRKDSSLSVHEAIRSFISIGFQEFVVTSIKRDGSLSGFDRTLAEKIPYEARRMTLIAGGVLLREIKEIERLGYSGCIIGKDIYENYFGDLKC